MIAVAACEKGSVEVVAPTAAATSVGGRVLMGSSLKRGLANATVTITDGVGNRADGAERILTAISNSSDVEAGQIYVFNVRRNVINSSRR